MRWTRRWLVGLAVAAAVTTSGVVAARWSSSSSGAARAKSQTVNIGNQPTATVSSSSVTLSWAAAALTPSGQAVTGYIVRRYDSGGVAQTVGAGCTGTVAALGCTENNVPSGAWRYSVTPALGNWRGPESARRDVTVAVPTVASLTPNFVFRNTTQSLTVTGANFVSGATVLFSGAGITINSTTFVSATQLTVSITVASGAVTGTRNVTVTNPGTLGSATCANCLTVPTAPTVTSVSPNSRGQGAVNQNITITGTFFNGATAAFGAGITVNSTTFVSSTQLTVNITVATTATIGIRTVTVTYPGGVGPGTCTNCFTVTTRPGTFTLNPNTRGQGAVNQNIVITGSSFVTGATVTFAGTGITINSTTFNSATQLTVNISVDPAAPTGARDVTITNPDGGTRTTASAFTVATRPNPTSIAPNTRARGSTGNHTITGTGFVSGAIVTFSGTGITVNTTTFNSATQLTVSLTVAAGAAPGVRNLTVTNPNAGTGTCLSCINVI